jgi:hypothetical protein
MIPSQPWIDREEQKSAWISLTLFAAACAALQLAALWWIPAPPEFLYLER